jgi:hypothetical protein
MTMLIRLLQTGIIAAPIVLFLWLLNLELVPTGVFAVPHSVDELSPFIDQVLPDTRALPPYTDADGDTVQPVVGDPAYFFVHPHRHFDRVDVEVWFKNAHVPIVELGGLAQAAGEVYDLQPLQNLIIDRSSWERIDEHGMVLLQRNKTYESIDAFLADPPPRYKIATYHHTLSEPYRIAGYHPSGESRTIDVSLRGFHEFYTYIKDETLLFDFRFMDMNRKNGLDPVSIVVLNEQGSAVAEARVQDDGNISDDARPSVMRQALLEVPGLPEGVYKIHMRAERDIFFRTITTTQQKMTFLNNVYLGDEVAYREPSNPVRFWTEAKQLRFATQHADAMQEIRVGGAIVRVLEPYLEYRYAVPEAGVVQVDAPEGDAIVYADGHIAFSPEQFFNPDPVRLAASTDLDRLDVDYIIAEYAPPRREGNWFVQTVSFDATLLAKEEGTWKFAISVPGIEDIQGELLLGSLNMKFFRQPLTVHAIVAEIQERR